MNEPSGDQQLIEEIRGLRADLRKGVRNALWVFGSAVILVCCTWRPELLGVVGVLTIAFIALYLLGMTFQSIFNWKLRKRRQQEDFALLSGRVSVARRKPE
jgi:hypothetical protein